MSDYGAHVDALNTLFLISSYLTKSMLSSERIRDDTARVVKTFYHAANKTKVDFSNLPKLQEYLKVYLKDYLAKSESIQITSRDIHFSSIFFQKTIDRIKGDAAEGLRRGTEAEVVSAVADMVEAEIPKVSITEAEQIQGLAYKTELLKFYTAIITLIAVIFGSLAVQNQDEEPLRIESCVYDTDDIVNAILDKLEDRGVLPAYDEDLALPNPEGESTRT